MDDIFGTHTVAPRDDHDQQRQAKPQAA